MQGRESFLPSTPLSRAAAGLTRERIEELVAEERGFELHLVDVSPAADLCRIFGRWQGECRVSGRDSQGCAMVSFFSEQRLREAVGAFGGGIRGVFLIDRQQTMMGAAI